MLQSASLGTQACAATCMRLSPTLNAAGTTGAPGLAQHQRRASARRSLGTKFAATAATGDSSSDGSGGSSSSSSPPRQQQYKVGASVYDASHHGASSCRGYGRIVGGADIADDGTQRWKVEWEKEGSRIKPIKETYLELSLIDHRRRTPPSGLDQPILVVLGTHKGKTGVTKKKSGSGFSCKLDGVHGLQHCNPDSLHATGLPPKEKELQQFQAKVLAGSLPVAELQGWLTAFQEDPPCDLLRNKPDSGVWCDVLTGQRSIDSLSDDELLRLHYVASRYCSAAAAAQGGTCNGQGDAAAADTAGGKAALSAAAIRAGLQKAAQGGWTIKLVCSHSPATKCGCPFALEIKHRGGGLVEVWQTEAHQFHDPTSHADLSQLRMSPQAEAYASWLLECGTPPVRVALLVNNKLVKDGAAAPAGSPDGSSGSSGGGASAEPGSSGSDSTMGLALFSNARLFITKEQVKALLKRIQREAGFGLTTDERAVAAQMAVLAKEGCLGFYQPYKQGGKDGKGGQPLIIILQTRFQKRMLLAFGRRLVFLDATGGTNKYGYMLYAVVIVDESGRGVPVGFMICSADPAEVVEKFLRELQRGANEEAKALGVEAFTFGHIMIDKSLTEMAAVHLLVLSGDALGWLLCYFHMLQDWERFLTSAESGVVGREAQHNVMLALARLAHCREESAFKAQLELFYAAYAACPAVCGRMKSAWESLAERWAWYARVELLDLRSNTNNPVERCFGLVKYTDLGRKTQSTIQQLVETLLSKTVARNMYNRGLMLAGRSTSEQQRAEQRAERQVEALVAGGKVQAASPEGSTTVRCDSGNKRVCVGDLSCSCSYSAEYVCIHIAAAARQVGYTPALRKRAAAYLVSSGLIQVEEATGICCCPALGDPLGKSMTFRPADGFCTCHGYALHNTCCHLLAAAELPAFREVHIPVMVHAAAENEGTRIDISCQRTFQQAPFEPMGDDMGAGELSSLLATQSATAAAVQRGQSNADPAVAAIRGDLATVQRIALGLPAEEQQELQQAIKDLRSKAEGMAEAAHMQPTETRVGKQDRRRNGRPEGQRVLTALYEGRKNKRSRAALIHQQQEQVQAEDCSDPLPKATKRGRPTHKMRGVTVPGNIDGTVVRNGAPHHRRPKRR